MRSCGATKVALSEPSAGLMLLKLRDHLLLRKEEVDACPSANKGLVARGAQPVGPDHHVVRVDEAALPAGGGSEERLGLDNDTCLACSVPVLQDAS